MSRRYALTACATLLALAVAQPASAVMVFATNNNGSTLIRFDTATPGSFTTVGDFSGGPILGLDFRPANGQLYGYTGNDQIVRIDLNTAGTTVTSTPTIPSTTGDLGLDFNPVADRLRLVNTAEPDQNLRIVVDTGLTVSDPELRYAAGDPNFGVDPNINETAYTNNVAGLFGTTTQYYLDNSTNTLATTADPNSGLLTTVGNLGVNFGVNTGFDIFTDLQGTNSAFALLEVNDVIGFYSINLASGAATFRGLLAGDRPVVDAYGLAIVPAAVPEPSSFVTAGVGAMMVLGYSWKRRRQGAAA